MKNLFLVRHAKSSWDDIMLADFDRPLNERGHKNATEMAERILERNITVDQIICSTANRAKTTAKYFKDLLKVEENQFAEESSLYESTLENVRKIVEEVDDEVENLFLFGHNPTFTYFANAHSNANIMNIPTCGMVQIEFQSDNWKNAFEKKGKLIFYDFPKNKNWKDTLIEK